MKRCMLIFFWAVLSLFIFTSCAKQDKKKQGLTPFTAENIMGGEETQNIFSNCSLNMVFVWNSSDEGNVEQLKHLEKIKDCFDKKDLGIVGIISDISFKTNAGKDSKIDNALDVISKSGTNFVQLLESKDIYNLKLKNSTQVPQIFFVDSKGYYVGDSISRMMTSEEWTETIQERLLMVTNDAY